MERTIISPGEPWRPEAGRSDARRPGARVSARIRAVLATLLRAAWHGWLGASPYCAGLYWFAGAAPVRRVRR